MGPITAEQSAQLLVVDDDARSIARMRWQLERAGYSVLAAMSGQEALDVAASMQPDLILLDAVMPGLDGYEVCRRLRDDRITRAIPIVMLASIQERADNLRALETGADDFLSKPVDTTELLARVRSSLRMKRVYDDLDQSKRQLDQQAHELAAEQSRAEAILSSMSDGVLMTDAEGRITFMNPAVEMIAGVVPANCFGRPWYEALAARSDSGTPIDADTCPVLEAMQGYGRVVEREFSIWRDDGREIIISLTASPVYSSQTSVRGGVVVFRDVTVARDIQRMKEDFVSLVSHELRTPLSAIFGFAELTLDRERLSNTARAYLETIYKEADRMKSLVNDFLDIERLASGRMSFHFRSMRVDEVVNEVGQDLTNQLVRHSFVFDGPMDPVYVRADRDRMMQVVLNLISNAIKYSPDGGEIRVRVEPLGRLVRISVADQGLGLPLAAIPKLFERFYRVEEAGHRQVGGTGLGLAICKQIVEAMGGRVWAESPGLGLGSTFSFTLPSAGAPVHHSPQALLGSSGRILLAKDDPLLAAVILEQLGPAGYAVEAVSAGEDAIAHIRSERPSAVVLEAGGGEQADGWSVLAALREDAATEELPAILISGRSDLDHGLALAVDDFLPKPVRSHRLIGVISRLVGGQPAAGTVIVADSDPASRQVVEEILVGGGFDVLTAHDGDSALEALRHTDPLALVLDPMMQNVDGFDVLDAVRADERLSDLPVVMLLAKNLSDGERQELRQRTHEVLARPGGSATNVATALSRAIQARSRRQAPAGVCAVNRREEVAALATPAR